MLFRSAAAESASRALRLALDVLLRLFAPVLPFATEEVWSWWQPGSVHRQSWPDAQVLRDAGGEGGDPALLTVAGEVLSQIRKVKSTNKVSMRAEVDRVEVRAVPERAALARQAEADLRGAGVAARFEVVEVADAAAEGVDVTLAPAAVLGAQQACASRA